MTAMTEQDFTAWLAREMPAGTVIGDPAWWAKRIFRATATIAPAAAPEPVDGRAVISMLRRAMDSAGVTGDMRAMLVGFFSNEWNGAFAKADWPAPPAPTPRRDKRA